MFCFCGYPAFRAGCFRASNHRSCRCGGLDGWHCGKRHKETVNITKLSSAVAQSQGKKDSSGILARQQHKCQELWSHSHITALTWFGVHSVCWHRWHGGHRGWNRLKSGGGRRRRGRCRSRWWWRGSCRRGLRFWGCCSLRSSSWKVQGELMSCF